MLFQFNEISAAEVNNCASFRLKELDGESWILVISCCLLVHL